MFAVTLWAWLVIAGVGPTGAGRYVLHVGQGGLILGANPIYDPDAVSVNAGLADVFEGGKR
jgi:hypothetical protein